MFYVLFFPFNKTNSVSMSYSTTPNRLSSAFESPNVVRVTISTPRAASEKELTPTSDEVVAAGRRLSLSDNEEEAVAVAAVETASKLVNDSGSQDDELQCEIDSLKEQLQQALEDKAELIDESLLDKERIKDQKETIELLTKRIREFEMARSPKPNALTLPLPSRTRSSTTHTSQIKQLSEDNIQLAREVDRLIAERDRLEKKLIDIKIKFANGYLSRQNSGASTDEDEIDNEANIFSTLSVDEKLRRKKAKQRILGSSSKTSSGVFSAARSWFSRSKKANSVAPSPVRSSRVFTKSNEIEHGVAV